MSSNVIDDRVVSLEFDNSNFESNVSTTISTLDKLKAKLSLSGASSGLEKVQKTASSTPASLAGISESLDALNSRFSTMGIVGATAISNITTKVMQLFGRATNFLTNGIIQGGISRALKIETAKFQLNALLKDSDAVAAVMKNVSNAVDGTAYSLDAAASVASQLAASGMTAGEQMESTLKGISGVAAMTSSSYEDIGRIFTQVAGQGKLMGDQLLQLSSRGMNAAADIAKYLTKIGDGAEVTEAQVRTMVTNGKIDFDTFAKAMSDTYADAAFKANETVTGNISNIKAALAKIGATFVQPLVASNGPLVQLLQAVREKIVAIKDKLVSPLETASEKVGNILTKLAGIIKGNSFSFDNDAWDELSQKIQDAGINIEDFQNKFKEVAKQQGIDVDTLIEKTGSFGAALMEMKNPGKIAIQTLKDISKEYKQNGIDQEKLQEKLSYLQEMVDQTWYGTWNNQPIRQKLMEQYGHNYQEIQDLVNKTVDQHRLTVDDLNESTLKNLGYTEDQIKLLQDLTKEASKSGTSLNDLMNSLNKPSKSFLLYDSFGNIFSGVKTVCNSIKEAFTDVFSSLKDVDILGNFINGLHDISKAFVVSDDGAQKLTRTFKGFFSVISLLGKAISSVGSFVTSLFSNGAISSLGNIFLTLTATVGDFFTSLNNGIKTDGIKGAFTELGSYISGVLNRISGVTSSASDKIGDVFSKIKDKISTSISWIKDNLTFSDVLKAVTTGGLLTYLNKIGTQATKFMKEIMSIMALFKQNINANKPTNIVSNISKTLSTTANALNEFAKTVKVGQLVLVSTAIYLLTSALNKLSNISPDKIVIGAAGLLGASKTLQNAFKNILAALEGAKAKGLIKSSVSLVLIAESLNVLANAIGKLSKLDIEGLAKGLAGVWAGLKILTSSLAQMSGVKSSIKNAMSLIILAETCKILAKAMKSFAEMSWEEIAKGAVAMGAALTEVVASIKVLELNGKKSKSALSGAVSMLLVALSLKKIANAFKDFGSMNWSSIKSASIAMGAALTEIVASIKVLELGKNSFKNLTGAASLKIVISSLSDLAEGFTTFSQFNITEGLQGLTLLGGALAEVAIISGILGEVTGLNGLLGAVSLKVGIESLGDLAEAFTVFAGFDESEVKMGLVAMGGALAELAVIEGLLGNLSGFSALLGGLALDVGVESLSKLADGLAKFGSMNWDEIGKGIVAMGGALAEVSFANLISGIGGLASVLGAGSIDLASAGLNDIADALTKFGSLQWDEIGKGLTAMHGALMDTALASLLNMFGGPGAKALSVAAPAIGKLADAVKKWSDVNVPSDLGSQLNSIATGLLPFTLDTFGASAISTVAKPLGTMADSIKKWIGVTVPDHLEPGLKSLASGIKAFTLGNFGGDAISAIAKPLGTLASSVIAWKGVTVPDNLGSNLSEVAKGVKAFTLGDLAAGTISTLANSMKKFASGIDSLCSTYIPTDLGDKLALIGNGIKSFNFSGTGANSIETIAPVLSTFADGLQKLIVLSIPDNIGTKFGDIADAVKKFSDCQQASYVIAAIGPGMSSFSDGIIKMVNVTIPDNFAANLGDIAGSLNKFMNITNLESTASSMKEMANAITKLSAVDLVTLSANLSALGGSFSSFATSSASLQGAGETIQANITSPLKKAAKSMDSLGSDIITSITQGFTNNSDSLTASLNGVMTTIAGNIKTNAFKTAGKSCADAFGKGLIKGASGAKTSAKTMATNAASAANKTGKFKTAGHACAKGFAAGITAGSSTAISAAVNMAVAAYNAAKKKLDVNSPSKLFRRMAICVPEGFAQGITRGIKYVVNASEKMAESSIDTTSSVLNQITSLNLDAIDANPTITPMVDLSNVTTGANRIASMLNLNPSVGLATNLGAINSGMSSRIQNGQNNDVVNALQDLKRTITKSAKPTYNINGVTYDDGSNVSQAVGDLVRAVKVEGRM